MHTTAHSNSAAQHQRKQFLEQKAIPDQLRSAAVHFVADAVESVYSQRLHEDFQLLSEDQRRSQQQALGGVDTMFEALMASDRKLAYKIKRGAEIVLDESVRLLAVRDPSTLNHPPHNRVLGIKMQIYSALQAAGNSILDGNILQGEELVRSPPNGWLQHHDFIDSIKAALRLHLAERLHNGPALESIDSKNSDFDVHLKELVNLLVIFYTLLHGHAAHAELTNERRMQEMQEALFTYNVPHTFQHAPAYTAAALSLAKDRREVEVLGHAQKAFMTTRMSQRYA